MFRDTDVNAFDGAARSAPLRSLAKAFGASELAQNYTVTSDTWGTLAPLQSYLDHMTFVLESHEPRVENRNPYPGGPILSCGPVLRQDPA